MSTQPHTWSRAQWISATVVVFILQAGLLLFFSAPLPARPDESTSSIKMVMGADLSDHETDLLDPTSLAFPEKNGFTKAAFTPALSFQPALTAPTDRSIYFTPDPLRLGKPIAQTLAEQSQETLEIAELSPVAFKIEAPEERPILTRTYATVVQGTGRELIQQPKLPSLSTSTPLAPTEVELLVTPLGNVISQRLIPRQSKGDEVQTLADAQATLLAKNLVFNKLPSRNPSATFDPSQSTWIRVRFHWHVEAE